MSGYTIIPFATSVCQFCPFAKIKTFFLQPNLSCESELMTSEWKTDASCRRIPQEDKEHASRTGYRVCEAQGKTKTLGPFVQKSGKKCH